MRNKWYLQTWLIVLLFSFWFLIIPGIIGIILVILQYKQNRENKRYLEHLDIDSVLNVQAKKEEIEDEIEALEQKLASINQQVDLQFEEHRINEEIKIQKQKLESINERYKEEEGIAVRKFEEIKSRLTTEIASVEQSLASEKKRIEIEIKLLEQKRDTETKLMENEIGNIQRKVEEKKNELVILEDELLLQSFGFYDPKYDLENSDQYKVKLNEIRLKQKELVKNKNATIHSEDWTLDGSKQKGNVMNNNNIKLTISSFNNECDTAISKVKFNNINSIETRIKKAFDNLNKVNKQNRIEIKSEYLALKLDELYLAYEYAQKVEEEREEQRQIREQMREEERALKEFQKEIEKIEKEETHFKNEISSLRKRLTDEHNEKNAALLRKIDELESKLELLKEDKEDVENRSQNTRAGYVYIISNIGSFGENIYKIGMTRRLIPEERVKELGDASVPFLFDTHAFIFSQDAPSLENALHKAFAHKRLNKVNYRKEFFNVTLGEISNEVKKNHNEVVQFTKLAQAKEYRETLEINKREASIYKPSKSPNPLTEPTEERARELVGAF